MELKEVLSVLEAATSGVDLIEEPSANGGVFVDEETLELVADLQTVSQIGFEGKVMRAAAVLIQVMRNAPDKNEDPFEAGRDWLDGWLDGWQQLVEVEEKPQH